MDPVLRESVEPILRDLARAGINAPRFGDDDWVGDREYVSSMMWSEDGSGSGLSVRRTARLDDRIAQAADQVQEWAIENQLWGLARTNWPPCPNHPESHPLQASAAGSNAVWVCPADHSVVAPIGDV
jgi:hypothetical protein